MIKLKTINTLELSSICNMACLYCTNRLMEQNGRKREIMSDEVFKLSLTWLSRLVARGTQKEVNINGIGESTLDPSLLDRIRAIINVVGDRQVSFCTNGITMTDDLAVALREAGLKRVDISSHNAFYARKAAQSLFKAGIAGCLATGAIASPHNWAGQLEPEYCVDKVVPLQCDPLIEGRGYVQSDGKVTPCCYDYRSLGSFGSVFDHDLLERHIKPYTLCEKCHQTIPQEVLQECFSQ